jgi:cytochrome c oxidase cbb3-type subunit 3
MKMNGKAVVVFASFISVMSNVGCHRTIGPPNDQEELARPESIVSFDRLYKQNCSACHGEQGTGGPAVDLANPGYQALVDDASLRRWITSGVPGTEMPAFGQSAGGLLTPQQVEALVSGIRSRWAHAGQRAQDMPQYSSNAVGSVEQGRQVFQMSCLSCHQQEHQKVTDTSYLAQVSDQSLRSIIIAGRPDLGQPDYKQVRPSNPLTNEDVNNIVAYLHSLRSDTPGQPYPETNIRR